LVIPAAKGDSSVDHIFTLKVLALICRNKFQLRIDLRPIAVTVKGWQESDSPFAAHATTAIIHHAGLLARLD
jgi:hypothetical protein